jgi:hypothetical protein
MLRIRRPNGTLMASWRGGLPALPEDVALPVRVRGQFDALMKPTGSAKR